MEQETHLSQVGLAYDFSRILRPSLLELYDGDLGGALHWLTAPNVVLSNERPVELLVTGFGTRAVRQAIRAIEYGLPV